MALIKKFTSQNADQFIKEPGDQILGKFGHLNYLLRQINSSLLSFAPGSVLFSDSNGDPAGDPTQLYWDDVNNRLGIGLNTPTSALHVIGGANVAAPLGTLPIGYNTGALKLPQLTIEAVVRGDMNTRHLIRAGGWHTSTWFGAETMLNWINSGGSSATQNDAFGIKALSACTTCNNNQAFGGWALFALTTGTQNCAFGLDSLWKLIDGSANTAYGYLSGESLTTGSYNTFIGQRAGRGITTGSYNTVLGGQVQSLSTTLANHIIIADGQNNRRFVAFNDGNIYLGGGTSLPTNAGYKVDVEGTMRVQGTELRLDNATTGTINLYSNTPRVNFFSGGGYSIGRSGTSVELISAGSIAFYIGANQGYGLDATNGHIFRTAIAGGAALARLDTGGSLSIGKSSNAAVASSIVELSSTTKGFLPPRMTGAQVLLIASPAEGLMVYATSASGAITSKGWWGYNGATWIQLG